jgi:RNA polymerase sigma-70 factor (ECF subfamily)
MDNLQRCSEEDLLLRARKVDRDAFEALVCRYERELHGYLRRYLGNSCLL